MASCLRWCEKPDFFHTLCWTDKRMNICVPSLRRSPGWQSAICCILWFDFCWGLLSLCLLLLLLLSSSSFLFFFYLKIVFKLASLSTWFWVRVSNQYFTGGFLLNFYLFILFLFLFFFGAIAWDPQSSALCTLLSMTGHSCRNVIPVRYECLLQWKQNRSKATMWLLHKFQKFEGAQDIVTRMKAVCCMLLPHNPYRLPQHYKRHVYGLLYSCKYWFLWISPIFEH